MKATVDLAGAQRVAAAVIREAHREAGYPEGTIPEPLTTMIERKVIAVLLALAERTDRR